MLRTCLAKLQPLLKPLLALSLVLALVAIDAGDALAARGGGRMGGGGFRAPRSTAPPRSSGPRARGGGGIGFPFFLPLPFFGVGGFGSLFSILIFFVVANFIVRSIRSSGLLGGTAGSTGAPAVGSGNPQVTIAQVQVGLLADARELQRELNELAQTANTSSKTGRSLLLQEATLALLRQPEYWAYGAAHAERASLDAAEAQFNQLALAERSKFSQETLSNVDGQLQQSAPQSPEASEATASGEYVLVTLLVGAEGNLDLPDVNSADGLRQALRQLGSLSSDRLLAVEVLWTPQAESDTLTADDLLAQYPNLKLV